MYTYVRLSVTLFSWGTSLSKIWLDITKKSIKIVFSNYFDWLLKGLYFIVLHKLINGNFSFKLNLFSWDHSGLTSLPSIPLVPLFAIYFRLVTTFNLSSSARTARPVARAFPLMIRPETNSSSDVVRFIHRFTATTKTNRISLWDFVVSRQI